MSYIKERIKEFNLFFYPSKMIDVLTGDYMIDAGLNSKSFIQEIDDFSKHPTVIKFNRLVEYHTLLKKYVKEMENDMILIKNSFEHGHK
jgi:hypothetical protein